jgi:hypothetical protein
MEAFDTPPGISADLIAQALEKLGGNLWGAWAGGGLFGIESNQMVIVSAWPNEAEFFAEQWEGVLRQSFELKLLQNSLLEATSRPAASDRLGYKTGMVVFRWVKMLPENTDKYADQSIPCWSYFETGRQVHAIGLFKEKTVQENTQRMLIVTWYPDFTEWEASRDVGEQDRILWAKRASLEISHFGIAARMVA